MEVTVTPQLTVPTVQDALSRVNRWLHHEIGTAVHAASATFDPATFYWHVSIELAYGATGPVRTVGDVYLHAASGDFAGRPSVEDFRQRAEAIAAAQGIK
ncbi:MAG: hypothetical protein J2P31_07855 [Blastocatellia bacterium]|nr:hypothetical protein [Blastocatellia bacterium]